MGSHEGLGLGFFESLYCGTPIITMNWIPNNEIIINNTNGWIIECIKGEIYDNDNSLINKGIINEIDLKNKITEILINKENTLKIINNTINNKNILYEKNKNIFNKNITNILSS
jgi:glycosyltransferase involved in cell wall biosynthesis